jgi:error-prone DNA polymerase
VVHLNVHSRYSLMRGVPDVQTLASAARDRGCESLALTDTNGLYGLVFFLQAAQEAGIRPIIGAEIDEGSQSRAVLLAKNHDGYAALCRHVSAYHLARASAQVRVPAALGSSLRDPRAPLAERLAKDHDGLAILSDAPAVLRALPSAADAWVELRSLAWRTDHAALLALARTLGREPVATHPVYFVHRAEHALHKLLRAIHGNTTLSRLRADDLVPEDATLLDADEMRRRFPHTPFALANTQEVAARCTLAWPFGRTVAPGFAATSEDAATLLRAHAYAGAAERYGTRADGSLSPDVTSRLEYELEIIVAKGFAEYFLVVEDIVRRTPRTCGRGSAAASIVSYVLRITHVDPLAHNLFFERFLNPGRTDPPDIDVDFPWDERDAVLDDIFTRYGNGRAAMVANHVGFRARAAVREVAKVYGLPDVEIARVTNRLSQFWNATSAEDVVADHPLFRDLHLDPPWPEILRLASLLEDHVRHLSVHCGGVVIVPDAVAHHAPVEIAPKGLPVLQWEKDQVEDAGLVKIDILGNRSLAVIRDCVATLGESGALRFDPAQWDPLHDPGAQALLVQGETVGVFYVESPAMRQLLRKARTGDFEHLVVMSSLVRPAANQYIHQWLERLHGAPYVPLHPVLGEILSETYGLMVYQEDVTRVAMALAGFDAVDGDGLRKALSKKRPVRTLRAYCTRFVAGAAARGVGAETIERIWDMILSFSGYSFCKPHSASYALVSYQSAYLRAHHPAEFMAAVLSNGGGYYATFAYVSEAKRMGLTVLPPHVNASEIAYTGCGTTVRVGLMQIRSLTRAAQEAIVAARRAGGPFAALQDLLERTALTHADTRVLILAGACDGIEPGKSRPELLWTLHLLKGPSSAPAGAARSAVSGARGRAGPRRSVEAALSLFAGEEDVPRLAPPAVGEYDAATLLRLEVEALGFLLSRHPLTLYRNRLRDLRVMPARDIHRHAGRRVRMIGWFVTSKTVTTRTEEPMEFVSFEDTTGLYEATFFPDAYRRFCHMLSASRPYLLEGTIEEDFGAYTLTVREASFLDTRRTLRHSPAQSRGGSYRTERSLA